MSDTLGGLRRKIDGARELQSVVRTMKAIAGANIGQYERSVRSLAEYESSIELGLGACLREGVLEEAKGERGQLRLDAVVFGSDQGLVGRFNDVVIDEAARVLGERARNARIFAVGERVHGRLVDRGFAVAGVFPVPLSARGIAPLVGRVLVDVVARSGPELPRELRLFHNQRTARSDYAAVTERLLPLDAEWRRQMIGRAWPTTTPAEIVGGPLPTLRALVRGHLFVALFRAVAESLASENASRLAAMERADENIDDLLGALDGQFHRLRKDGIDEELFDVVSGYEALSSPSGRS